MVNRGEKTVRVKTAVLDAAVSGLALIFIEQGGPGCLGQVCSQHHQRAQNTQRFDFLLALLSKQS